MNNYREETKRNVFIALTTIYRNVVNGKTKISWSEAFRNAEIKNQRLIANTKKALITMGVIKIDGKNTYWNRNKTVPNPLLVDGIFKTIKENRVSVNRVDGKSVSKPSGYQMPVKDKIETKNSVWCVYKTMNIASVPSICVPQIFETEAKARNVFNFEVERIKEENKIAIETKISRLVVSESSIALYNVQHPTEHCIMLQIKEITVK